MRAVPLPVSVDRRTVRTWTEGVIQIFDRTYVISRALGEFDVLSVEPSVDDENVHINACDSAREGVIEMNVFVIGRYE